MSEHLNQKNIYPAALLMRFDGGDVGLALGQALQHAGMTVVALCSTESIARGAQSAGFTPIYAQDAKQRLQTAVALLDGEGAHWPGYVLVDASAGYSAPDVLAIAQELVDQPDRLILAERAEPWERGMLFRRERRLGSSLLRALHGVQASDPWCTLRGIPRSFVAELLAEYDNPRRFWLGMLLTLRRRGIKTVGVAIGKPYRRETGANTWSRCADLLRIAEQTLRYVASSVTVMLVDTGLFSLFFYLILNGNRPISLAIGRFTGALLGYFLNRSIVFRQKRSSWRREAYTAGKYALLVAINYGLALGLNYLVAAGLLHLLQPKLAVFVSKLLADLLLYIFTFFVNREIVFRKRRRPSRHKKQQHS